MDIITRLFDSFLNILSGIFFIACIIVFGGMVWDYSSAVTNKALINSPHTYNVHTVTTRQENRFSADNTCWYIEKDGKEITQAQSNAGKNCYVPDSVIKNWKDHGENYRKLGFKFWAGMLVFLVIGTLVFAWLPTRMMGATPLGGVTAVICFVIVALMTLFMTMQDVRAAYAPPSIWFAKENGINYKGEVKFFLQDKDGKVYNWSPGGTADSSRVSDLAKPVTNYVK